MEKSEKKDDSGLRDLKREMIVIDASEVQLIKTQASSAHVHFTDVDDKKHVLQNNAIADTNYSARRD